MSSSRRLSRVAGLALVLGLGACACAASPFANVVNEPFASVCNGPQGAIIVDDDGIHTAAAAPSTPPPD